MKTENAIKMLKEAGAEIEIIKEWGKIVAHFKNGYTITMFDVNGKVDGFIARSPGENNMIEADYFAGTYFKDLERAIRFVLS